MSEQALLPIEILAGIGKGFSITGLVLAMPFCFAFRSYLRFLDHLQLFYVFAYLLTPQYLLFSDNLDFSWVAFDKNIFFFCTPGDFVCTAGFPLSFGSCLLLFLLAMKAIVEIQKCRKKQIKFDPVYKFFKGLTRWIYAALSFWSIYYLIATIKGLKDSLYSSIGVVIICVLFPIVQLIGYKILQTEKDNIWVKWLQFLNFMRLLGIVGLMAVGSILNTLIPYYIIYGLYVVYAILFTIKHTFQFRVIGRIVFILGQVIAVGGFSLFLFFPQIIYTYSLDFIMAGTILLLDLIYSIFEIVSICKNGAVAETGSQKVSPQQNEPAVGKSGKKNAYQVDLNDNDNQFNNSREDLYSKQQLSPKQSKDRIKPPKRR